MGACTLYYMHSYRTSKVYDMRMIEMVKEMVPNARPDVINCAFGYAAFATMKNCFPNVEIRGCLFHFSQNLLKQIKIMGLMGSYNSIPNFVSNAKMVTALSLYQMTILTVTGMLLPRPCLRNWFRSKLV